MRHHLQLLAYIKSLIVKLTSVNGELNFARNMHCVLKYGISTISISLLWLFVSFGMASLTFPPRPLCVLHMVSVYK